MVTTLNDWLLAQPIRNAAVRDGVTSVAKACGIISRLVDRAPFEGHLGALDSENVQGETQKALDVLSNDVFLEVCGAEPSFAAFASEELDDIVAGAADGELLLAFDPLDGSSNIEVSMCVGSIFSMLAKPPGAVGRAPAADDFLQPGRNQLAAGYALYGPHTILVLSVGQEVAGFTLDREGGAWILTHPGLHVPEQTSEYAINASNERHWPQGLQRFSDALKAGVEGPLGRNFNMRWTASMVADVHRVLVRGGVFLYPADRRPKVAKGKLRLLYECAPMGWLVEKAGGLALGASGPVLDVTPASLHEREPILLGSRLLVEAAWQEMRND